MSASTIFPLTRIERELWQEENDLQRPNLPIESHLCRIYISFRNFAEFMGRVLKDGFCRLKSFKTRSREL